MCKPEDFGLDEKLAEYLGMQVGQLKDFVQLLKVPFGKEKAMAKKAWSMLSKDERSGESAEYVENLIADAKQLRKQHENLIRRREAFAEYIRPYILTEMVPEDSNFFAGDFYKWHRKAFEQSEAQVNNRKHDEKVAGQFIYANNILLSVF